VISEEVSGSGTPKERLYDGFALIGQALSSGRRLEILDLLAQASPYVGKLAEQTGQSMANTSRHLQILLQSGLVKTRREGHRIVYELARPEVAQLLSLMRDIAMDEIPEVRALAEAHLGTREEVDWISQRELAHRIRAANVVLIDVRPPNDYRAGHIIGSVNVQPGEMAEFAGSLPTDAEVIAYCRGHYCSLADIAIRELHRLGVPARRLEDGYPEWARRRPQDTVSA
jgi:rhodanese-related sulfurtransferase